MTLLHDAVQAARYGLAAHLCSHGVQGKLMSRGHEKLVLLATNLPGSFVLTFMGFVSMARGLAGRKTQRSSTMAIRSWGKPANLQQGRAHVQLTASKHCAVRADGHRQI